MWSRRLPLVFLAILLLAACSHTRSKTTCPQSGSTASPCAENQTPYPPLLVAGADIGAPVIGRVASAISWRKGYLADQESAQRYLVSRLKPLDLVLVNSNGKATHQLLPGTFVHVAIYLGGERELKRLRLWNKKEIQAHVREIRAGRHFIEADVKGVHLSAPNVILNTDQAVVLRPRVSSVRQERELLLHFYKELGKRFDFHFNADDDRSLFCAELAKHVLSDQNIPVRRVYGRNTVVPDEIIAAALTGKSRLRFVAYIRGQNGNWVALSKQDLKQAHFSTPPPPSRQTCS